MILLLIVLSIFIAVLAYVTYAQHEEISDFTRRLNMLSKNIELLEQDFIEQERVYQNVLRQLEQIDD